MCLSVPVLSSFGSESECRVRRCLQYFDHKVTLIRMVYHSFTHLGMSEDGQQHLLWFEKETKTTFSIKQKDFVIKVNPQQVMLTIFGPSNVRKGVVNHVSKCTRVIFFWFRIRMSCKTLFTILRSQSYPYTHGLSLLYSPWNVRRWSTAPAMVRKRDKNHIQHKIEGFCDQSIVNNVLHDILILNQKKITRVHLDTWLTTTFITFEGPKIVNSTCSGLNNIPKPCSA